MLKKTTHRGVIWFLFLAVFWPAVAASQEDRTDSPPSNHAEYCRLEYRRLHAETVQRYLATSSDPPALKERVARWLDGYALREADLSGVNSWEELHALGNVLIEDGCEHALVVGCLAHMDQTRGRLRSSKQRFDLTSQPILEGEFGAFNRFLMARRLVRWQYHENVGDRTQKAREKAVDAWLDLAAEPNQHAYLRLLWHDWQSLKLKGRQSEADLHLLEKASLDKRLPDWLREMLLAESAYDRA